MGTGEEGLSGARKGENKDTEHTPQLIVVSAALGLPAAVAHLTPVLLIVHSKTELLTLKHKHTGMLFSDISLTHTHNWEKISGLCKHAQLFDKVTLAFTAQNTNKQACKVTDPLSLWMNIQIAFNALNQMRK